MKPKLVFILLIISVICIAQPSKMEQLGKLYMSGNYEESIARAKEYLAVEADNIDYTLILGRALADYGQFKEAIPHLNFVVKNDLHHSWREAWALGYLGSCYYMLSDFEKSKNNLKACIELNATKNATNYATNRILQFGYHKFYKDWKVKESEHFRFHFQEMSDSEMKNYINSRESAFQKINDFFNTDLPKKIDFFVWNSREDAKKVLQADLGFANPHFCLIHSFVKQTRGHEMTHVITNYLAKNMVKTSLINEGTSVCFDLSNQDKEKLVLEWIEKNEREIDIKELWNNWKGYPEELSYPLAGIFVSKIIDTFVRENFLEFFADQRYENAKKVFGDEIDNIIAELENKFNTD
jgi:tetratricopeptide (TPR) repeat protein